MNNDDTNETPQVRENSAQNYQSRYMVDLSSENESEDTEEADE